MQLKNYKSGKDAVGSCRERMREVTSTDIHRHDGRYAVIKGYQVQLYNNKPAHQL
jgi:hypothetical protein